MDRRKGNKKVGMEAFCFLKSATLNFCLVLFVILLPTKSDVSAGGMQLQVLSPMQRVYLSTQVSAQPNPKIELWAARDEYESAQVALHSDQEITINSVESTELKEQKSGAVLTAQNFTYHFPAHVFLGKHTNNTPSSELDGEVPGWYPDPFEESSTLQFSGTRSILVTWHVPNGTQPGDYIGELIIRSSIGIYRIPITLHIWNFSLPAAPSFYVTNWLYSSQIESRYKVTRGTEEYWSVIEKVAQDMQEHRQSVIFIPLNLIRTTQFADGSIEFDFRNYERWVEIFKRHGFQIFEGSHLFHSSNSYDIRLKVGITSKPVEFGILQLATAEGQGFLKKLLQALQQENLKLGIQDKYLQHVSDEATIEKVPLYREIAALVHSTMPGVAIIDATDLAEETRTGMMDIPVTLMGKPIAKVPSGNAGQWGRWWYTSVVTKGLLPNRFIDYPLIKMRIIPWLSWRNNMSGYLHYAYNWWYTPSGKSPWQDVDQSGNYPPGDGFIVYPPTVNTLAMPVSSLRWEVFRDGAEDYEYLCLLEKLTFLVSQKASLSPFVPNSNAYYAIARSQKLMQDLRNMLVSPSNYPRDYSVIESLRRDMGSNIETLAALLNMY